MASGVTWSSTMDGKDYPSAMDKAVDAALRQAGIILERDIVSLADGFRDTGRHSGSITFQTRNAGSRVESPASAKDQVSKPTVKWLLHVGTNVEYAPHLEYGTVKMAAQPAFRPALMARKHDIVRDFGKWVAKFLKRGK